MQLLNAEGSEALAHTPAAIHHLAGTMRLQGAFLASTLFSSSALAVFADDAYHVDYHYALLGYPQQQTTFFQQPLPGSKASLIYTLSERNVLAAVNPKDGTLVWRQLLAPASNSSSGFLRAGDGQDTVVSAVDGQVAAWRSSDGRAAWTTSAGASEVKDLEVLELQDGLSTEGVKDVLVLSQETVPIVSRIDGGDGHAKWQYEDNSGDAPFQVSASATNIFYVSLHSTMLGNQKIKIHTLNTLTGARVDQYTLSSDTELSSRDSILFVGTNTVSPLIIWTDKSHKLLKVHIIGTKHTASLTIENRMGMDIDRITVHGPSRITSVSHFLVHYETAESNWAEVYHVNSKKNSVTKAYDLPLQAGRSVFTTSTIDANVYFTRISEGEIVTVSSASHGVLGRWPLSPAAVSVSGGAQPVHGISEVVIRSGSAQAVRSAVLLSNGYWVLTRNGEAGWTRPELLTGASSVVWAEFPEETALVQELELEGHQSVVQAYIHRWRRHIKDMEHFPEWAQALPQRILDSFRSTSTEPKDGKLTRDTFGFHKLLVVATNDGHLLCLDSGSAGRILWNLELSKLSSGTKLHSPKLKALPNGLVEIYGSAAERALVVEAVSGKLVGDVDSLTAEQKTAIGDKFTVEYTLKENELQGYTKDREAQTLLWSFTPPSGERIISVVSRPADDPVASIGRVLGDRRVLYKYLNPNLVLVSAVSEKQHGASFYLLDSASGNLLYSSSHESVDLTRPITSIVAENWLAYSFTVGSGADSRGPLLVVAELYESSIPDDRGPLGSAQNFSTTRPADVIGNPIKPAIFSQAYHIPEEISSMAVSRTRQGITSKELIVTLPDSNSIVGIPRLMIDPRRPVGRDPTSYETAEGLTKYSPLLVFDAKWYLNHKREVFGIDAVITSSSQLESTSLVFAYGLDVFGTRVSPSFSFDVLGKDFNKSQMLLTVAALFVGVLIVAPMVGRKQINTQWQSL